MNKFLTMLSGIYLLGKGLWAGLFAFVILFFHPMLFSGQELLMVKIKAAVSLWGIALSVGVFLKKNWARLGVLVTSALFLILGWCSNSVLVYAYLSNRSMMFPDQILMNGIFFLLIPLFFLSFFGGEAVRVLFGSSPNGDGRLDYSMKRNALIIGIFICVCPVVLSLGVSVSRRDTGKLGLWDTTEPGVPVIKVMI